MVTECMAFPPLLRALLLVVLPTKDKCLFIANIWYKDVIKPSDRD
jgi:hypothetical protein